MKDQIADRLLGRVRDLVYYETDQRLIVDIDLEHHQGSSGHGGGRGGESHQLRKAAAKATIKSGRKGL